MCSNNDATSDVSLAKRTEHSYSQRVMAKAPTRCRTPRERHFGPTSGPKAKLWPSPRKEPQAPHTVQLGVNLASTQWHRRLAGVTQLMATR
jgi:hypothetical protein